MVSVGSQIGKVLIVVTSPDSTFIQSTKHRLGFGIGVEEPSKLSMGVPVAGSRVSVCSIGWGRAWNRAIPAIDYQVEVRQIVEDRQIICVVKPHN